MTPLSDFTKKIKFKLLTVFFFKLVSSKMCDFTENYIQNCNGFYQKRKKKSNGFSPNPGCSTGNKIQDKDWHRFEHLIHILKQVVEIILPNSEASQQLLTTWQDLLNDLSSIEMTRSSIYSYSGFVSNQNNLPSAKFSGCIFFSFL